MARWTANPSNVNNGKTAAAVITQAAAPESSLRRSRGQSRTSKCHKNTAVTVANDGYTTPNISHQSSADNSFPPFRFDLPNWQSGNLF